MLIVAPVMAADGARYRSCQAGHAEAVGAFDLLANKYLELINRLSGNDKKKGGKRGK